MEAWEREARERFPEMASDLDEDIADYGVESAPYHLWFSLLPRCELAHEGNDEELLQRIYAFADWSMHQEASAIWNSAGVCFYEHIVTHPQAFLQYHRHVSPEIFDMTSTLLRDLLNPGQFEDLCARYGRQPADFDPAPDSGDGDGSSVI